MGEEINFTLSGRITEQDYVRAQLLNLRPRPIFAVVGAVIAALVVGASAYQVYRWSTGELNAVAATRLPAIVLGLFAYFSLLLPWRFRKSYRTARTLHEPLEMGITNEGLFGRTKYGESQMPWNLFYKFKENRHLFLVYQSDALMRIIPKRLLDGPAAVEAVREVLKREIRPAI